MKIGVDAAVLASIDNQAGNFWLSFNLLKALSKVDKKNQYILYSFCPIPRRILLCFGSNFHNIVLHPIKFWLQVRLSLELLLNKIDVFLGLNQALPYICPAKSVVFVLDLAFELFPNLFINNTKLSWQTKRAAQKANKIIVISKSTKKDLVKMYRVPVNKVTVIYPGGYRV